MESRPPSIPRDTRTLLFVVLASVSMLWVLARLRFPDQEPAPSPVQPVLAQITPPSAFDDIVGAVAQAQPRIEPLLVDDGGSPLRSAHRALKFRAGYAVMLVPPAAARPGAIPEPAPAASHVVRDPITGLTVLRVADATLVTPSIWSPRRLDTPRFLLGAEPAAGGLSLRPVFIGSLEAEPSQRWMGEIWRLPDSVDLTPGTFLFSSEGALAGLAIEEAGRPALLPGGRVISLADRLLREGPRPPGRLGIEVQALTPELVEATGTAAGVIVAWIDPSGPASGRLEVGDVIDRVGDRLVDSLAEWRSAAGALTEGQTAMLRVRRGALTLEVEITASGPAASTPRALGLGLRAIRGVGSEVIRVASGSAAARAGLRQGDVITLAGAVSAPSPQQVARAFAAAPPDRPLLAAVTRGDSHFVVGIEKRW